MQIDTSKNVIALSSQFTVAEFTDAIKPRGCKLSMDGRCVWQVNVFVERLWRIV